MIRTGAALEPIDQEIEVADGSRRWFSTLRTPLLDSMGAPMGIMAQSRDITERRALELELRAAQDYLQAAMNAGPLIRPPSA